jgi:prepilin peptidase CpaA
VNIPVSFPTLVVLVCTAIAAVTDWHNFTIRNFITLPLIASGIIYSAFFGAAKELADSICAVWMIVAILFIPYVLGAMGAGDVKLMAGVAAWLGIEKTFYVWVASSIAAGIYALILLVQPGELKRTLLGHQVILPITAGSLDLGPWEQVFYAEFDGRRKKRVVVKVMGL